jgi:hypothetical protein
MMFTTWQQRVLVNVIVVVCLVRSMTAIFSSRGMMQDSYANTEVMPQDADHACKSCRPNF